MAMNKILEMIKNEKVEWKKLGDVCEIIDYKRKPVKKSQRIPGEYPYYGANGIQDYINDYIFDGTFLLMGEDGSVMDEHNRPILHWVDNKKIWVNNHAHVLAEKNKNYNLRYIYYFLSKSDVSDIVNGLPPKINQKNLRNIDICFPTLETQEKIVKILDTMVDHFTQLQAELQAELQARNRQYEYYRDKLLSEEYLNKLSEKFGGKVEWKNLGDIGKISMCKRILKNQTSNIGEVPFYKIGTFGKTPDSFISKELFLEYKDKFSYPREGNILFSASGTIGRTVIFDGKDSYYQDSNIVWIDNDESQALDKYLYYFYQIVKWPVSKGGTISRIYNRDINKIKILVPPIAVQEYIVSILDNFNKIVSDINEGLPKEIELRQKQYEYYRERLLDFKREED